jgi:hypothetical protein
MRRFRETIVATRYFTYSEYVSVALFISCTTRMRHILLPSAACLALPYFPTISHKRYDCREKCIECRSYVLIFSTIFIRNISHSNKNSAIYYHKCTQFFMQITRYSFQIFFETCSFSTKIRKILKCQLS